MGLVENDRIGMRPTAIRRLTYPCSCWAQEVAGEQILRSVLDAAGEQILRNVLDAAQGRVW